jgi:hypothetical protein
LIVPPKEDVMADTTQTDPNSADVSADAKKSTDAGIADETAGYAEATALDEEDEGAGGTSVEKQIPTEGGTDEDNSTAQPR